MISDPNRTISETHPGTTERPISSADDDKLERGPFVRRVASALVDRKTGKSRGVVVGVTGPWGSGKSSILNLLRERLKEDHPDTIVVSFDPWLISGRNDLISEFINELRATIRSDHRVAEKLGSLIDSITKYGEKLAPAANLLNPRHHGANTPSAGLTSDQPDDNNPLDRFEIEDGTWRKATWCRRWLANEPRLPG